MVNFEWHVVLPIMVMNYVWWLIIARFLVDFTCMYMAIKDHFVKVLFTTLLMNIAVYLTSCLVIEGLFAYTYPSLDVLGLGLRPLWVSLENGIRLSMGSISLIFIVVAIVAIAVNFAIEYGVARLAFPEVDHKKLMSWLLLATCITVGLSMRAAYVRDSQRMAFIKAIEDGLIALKDKNMVLFHESFGTYKDGEEVNQYSLAYHLRDVVDAYKKDRPESKKRK